MTASLSGNTITQSGTDDLSVLTAAMATITSVGSGNGAYKIYDIGGKALRVDGTLTIDPRKEMLVGSGSWHVRTSGTLNAGVSYTKAGATLYSQGVAMVNTKNSPACCSGGGITISGIIDLKGAKIQCSSVFTFNGGSTLISRDGIVENINDQIGNVRFRHNANTTFDVNGLTTLGLQFDLLANKPAIFRNVSVRDANFGIEIYNSTGLVEIKSIPTRVGSLADYDNWSSSASNSSDLKLVNSEDGSNVLIVPSGASAQFGGRLYQEVKFLLTNESETAIQDAKVYLGDTDNGLRTSLTSRNGAVHNWTQDFTYLETTDSTGETPIFEVATAMYYRTNILSGGLSQPDGGEKVDLRGRTNVRGEDKFQFSFSHYNYEINTAEVRLRSIDALIIPKRLFLDSSIAEQDAATVAAYTEIGTSEQFYDYAKWWLTQNYSGQSATLVSRTGDTIDAGSYDIILDATATDILALTSTTLTIKASTFIGNLTTTGTVALNNAATINGMIADAVGDATLTIITPTGYDDEIKYFHSQADADAKTRVVAAGVQYRYQTSVAGGSVIWLRVESADDQALIVKHTLSTASGAHNFEILVTAVDIQLQSIIGSLSDLQTTANLAQRHACAANLQTRGRLEL